jgi:hypothetical protein
VDKVAKDLDFAALQDNIDHITFCNIESEVVSVSDRLYMLLKKDKKSLQKRTHGK